MIFLIPARAGSKRLPGKNKKIFCGLPLFMWSLATARRLARETDGYAIYVSTDDPDVLKGCPEAKPRDSAYAQDESTTQELVDLYLEAYDKHLSLVLLQPTSPTRPDSLVRMMIARGDACRSVTNGKPNGQCYVYRRGMEMVDVETEQGHDIDVLEQFNEAEKAMMEKFK